jgi:ABC-2 type transport system permease protein
MIRFLLSLFIPFRWFIIKMGVDYRQFILILKLKLTLDSRNVKSISGKTANAQLSQSFTQIFIGVLFAFLLYHIKSPFTFYYLAHSFVMVMMAMMIISEFTTILFDTSENAIILPLPVRGNTLSLARNAHVFIYLTMLAFNLSVASITAAILKFGIVSGLLFIFTIILNVMFTLFLANILYLGIMHIASGEKLKNLLMYFQIGIAILFMVGYQLGMKIVDKSSVEDIVVPLSTYSFFIPPAFFSGLIEAMTSVNYDQPHLIFIIEALLLPFIAIYFTGKYLTPVFNRKLIDLEQGDRNSKAITVVKWKNIWYQVMSFLFVFNTEERASFKLIWKMTGRERLFKQTLLPSFGYVIIMIVLPLFTGPKSITMLAQTDKYLVILYALLIVAATIPSSLLTGNNQHSTWIFKSIPLNSPAGIFKGSIKAAFARFFIPAYLVVSITVCSIWGMIVLPDVLIAFLAIYFFTLLFYYIQHPWFPFSTDKISSKGGEGFIKAFIVIIFAVAFGFFHKFLLSLFNNANLILIPVYVSAILYINRKLVYGKITWKAVDAVNAY